MHRLRDFFQSVEGLYVPCNLETLQRSYFYDFATLLIYSPHEVIGDTLNVRFPRDIQTFVNSPVDAETPLDGIEDPQMKARLHTLNEKWKRRKVEITPWIHDASFPLMPHLSDYFLGEHGQERQIKDSLRKGREVPLHVYLAYTHAEALRAEYFFERIQHDDDRVTMMSPERYLEVHRLFEQIAHPIEEESVHELRV